MLALALPQCAFAGCQHCPSPASTTRLTEGLVSQPRPRRCGSTSRVASSLAGRRTCVRRGCRAGVSSEDRGVHALSMYATQRGKQRETARQLGHSRVSPDLRMTSTRLDTYNIAQRRIKASLEKPRERDEAEWEVWRGDATVSPWVNWSSNPRDNAKQAHLDARVASRPDVHERKGERGGEEWHGDEGGERLVSARGGGEGQAPRRKDGEVDEGTSKTRRTKRKAMTSTSSQT